MKRKHSARGSSWSKADVKNEINEIFASFRVFVAGKRISLNSKKYSFFIK